MNAGLAMTGFDIQELWLRYFALGGLYPMSVLQAYADGQVDLDAGQHDVVVHALNEYLDEQHMDHPIRYSEDL